MKKMLMALVAVAVAFDSWAATEKVGDYTWTYRINGDTAEIYKGSSAAISPSPTNAVTIPSSLGGKVVTSIGNSAFRGCNGLTGITIPNSVTSIGDAAFSGCSGLTSVTIPDSVTELGEGAFDSCGSLMSVAIPNSVISIGDCAFYYCGGLTNVTIGNGVRFIGYEAFCDCGDLTKVVFTGNAPEDVDDSAFDDVAPSCVAVIYKGTTGWDDDHDGKWMGLTLQYVDGPFVAVRREWFGAAGDGKFSNPANWQYNEIPPDGSDVVISCNSAMTLDCDIDFKPRSITFSEDSALVTIGGNGAISDVYAITNRTTQQRHHVFNCPVSCKSGVMAKITLASARYMDFAGGITLTNIDRSEKPKTYCGTFTVTTTYDWNSGDSATLRSGSTLNLPNATYYDHNGRLTIEPGATCRVKQTKMDSNNDVYLTHRNDGVFIADIEMFSGYTKRGALESLSNFGDGVFVSKKLRAAYGGVLLPRKNMVLGADGIVRGTGYLRLHDFYSHYFGSYDDWSMYYSRMEDSSDYILYKVNDTDIAPSSLTFDTADWYDKHTPHTIRCKAPICGANADIAATISMIVIGTGEFSFECSYDDSSTWKWFSGGLAIKDTATLRVKPDCKPGNGAVDMEGGTTLVLPVAGTSTAAFGGDFTVSGVGKVKIVLGNTNDVLSAGKYTILTASSLPDVSRLELVNRTVEEAEFSTSTDGKVLSLAVTPLDTIYADVCGGKSVAVSLSWLNAHPAIIAAAGGDKTAALQSTSANGRLSVAECYVVGLDPEKADDDFRIASFPMNVDGTPDLANIEYYPPKALWNMPDAPVVLKGATTLEGPWRTVTEDSGAIGTSRPPMGTIVNG